ncbi:MAG: 5-(carboxyamino)imidazole ribonucleotide mutase [Syntrophomonadaceae bacterium]|nr:5-(carboxyamino)imidazole ribonucleotide mutase [Syntrophomonadaceae bacterium]
MGRVAVIMGSDSDLTVMKDACDVLERFGVEYELRIFSAHRTPRAASRYAREAADNGLDVIIAGAGGAAHLAGAIAAQTVLPVIGVPIKSAALSGVDSLYSTVQMPRGIPVATVAIDGAANAALLALQIMAVSDDKLRNRLVKERGRMADEVAEKDRLLGELGAAAYLAQKR